METGSSETDKIHKGIRFLSKYLRQNSTYFRNLDFPQFKDWVKAQIQYKSNDPVFLQRAKIRDLRKQHHPVLSELEHKLNCAIKRFESSPDKQKIEKIENDLEGAKKAILGLTQATVNSEDPKKTAILAKLENYKKKVASLEKDFASFQSPGSEKFELLQAEKELGTFKEKIGLAQYENELSSILHATGQKSTASGNSFEESAGHAIHKCVLPLARKNAKVVRGESVKILSKVTLGCARAEIDYMIIAPSHGEKEPCEVIAVIEVKRNPNDISWGFMLRQENLAWFSGLKDGYSTEMYRTNIFREGHFDKPAIHEENNEKFIFTTASFHRFKKDPDCGHFIDNLYFITRPRRIIGMESEEYSKVLYKISTDIRFDLQNDEYMAELFSWAQSITAPLQTKDVINLYLARKDWAQQFIFIE